MLPEEADLLDGLPGNQLRFCAPLMALLLQSMLTHFTRFCVSAQTEIAGRMDQDPDGER